MKDCVFCKIISGEISCHKIYEDDFCMAILDVSNDIYGHTIVIPKKHYESMITCDNSTLSRLIETCKKVGNHYVKDCGFDGYNIINSSGAAAEQMVKHVHFHILPRKVFDGHKVFAELSGCDANLADVCNALKFPEKEIVQEDFGDAVVIYTDGACSGNPGPGGWAAILNFKGKEKVLSGGEIETTNNRMELMAVIQALEAVKGDNDVKIYSDSAYVVNAFHQNWVDKWIAKNWRNSSDEPVANKELWQRLLNAMIGRDVEFVKVKGHADNENNNRCDALARNEIAKLEVL